MGIFRHAFEFGPRQGGGVQTVEALVETGATYTWVPRRILEGLGISPEFRRQFQMANGTIIERDVAQVVARINGRELYTLCIFGDEGSDSLLGVVTLEEFGLAG